ncbi:MAG TPA: hypothetical protein VM142_07975, partial [Acidimicrobiales bacterium]|nr:hypothetical protein [Acidimicrobiales bacterium]
ELLRTGVGTSRLSAQLVAGDAFYVRVPEDEGAGGTTATLASSVVILCIYGFHDLALHLVESAGRTGLLGPEPARRLMDAVAADAPTPRPWQRSGPALDLLRKVQRRLLPRTGGYQAFWSLREWPDQ